MHAEIPQVRLCNEISYRMRQAADTQLQGHAITEVWNDIGCDLFIRDSGSDELHLRQGIMFPLHNIIHFGNMDTFIIAAIELGQMRINFQNNNICRS